MAELSTSLSTDLRARAGRLFDRYAYPDWLRRHSQVVGAIGETLVRARLSAGDQLDAEHVVLAAYLHDIGRSPLVAGDGREHNELSALILAAEGLVGCAELARRHPIYAVLDPASTPTTIAEKVVFIADRRGGMSVEPLEARAADTAARHPRYADQIARAIPIAKAIEGDVFAGLPFGPDELAARVELPG
ncbi:MAG TPA: HD domain-containing protein [Candidatus Limnocylindria bacterium]